MPCMSSCSRTNPACLPAHNALCVFLHAHVPCLTAGTHATQAYLPIQAPLAYMLYMNSWAYTWVAWHLCTFRFYGIPAHSFCVALLLIYASLGSSCTRCFTCRLRHFRMIIYTSASLICTHVPFEYLLAYFIRRLVHSCLEWTFVHTYFAWHMPFALSIPPTYLCGGACTSLHAFSHTHSHALHMGPVYAHPSFSWWVGSEIVLLGSFCPYMLDIRCIVPSLLMHASHDVASALTLHVLTYTFASVRCCNYLH